MNCEEISGKIVRWMRETVEGAGASGLVTGLSGGIDSAVVLALSARAFPEGTLGVIMPCHSSGLDEIDAVLVAEALEVPYKKVILDAVYDQMVRAAAPEVPVEEARMAYANLKPRLRMSTLYFEGGLRNCLVAGTGNLSEIYIGYYTKYGDGGVDLEPIGELVKEEVRELASWLGVPEKVILKEPSAGLWDSQTDEEEMGFSYRELDHYILTGQAPEPVKERIERLRRISGHKRSMPPVCPLGLNRTSY